MAHQLIQILRSERVEFIVAPYEADAQLAYLSTLDVSQGGIEAVITEDSDLIAYGCKAIIFKMDRYGNGEEFLMENVLNNASNGLSFRHFDKELFTGMCVLAGCDFLPSVPGIGTKRAHSLVSKYRNLDRVLSVLKSDKRYQVPEDYSESFGKAMAVFHHARIYDADTRSLNHLNPLEQKHIRSLNADLDLLGPNLPPAIAAAIAQGHLNPITMEAFKHFPDAVAFNDSVTTPNLNHMVPKESQPGSIQESCMTILSAHQSSSDQQSTVSKEMIVSNQEKYKKEALALGKLATRVECQQVVKHELGTREMPNNNPFKRRKLETLTAKQRESCAQQIVLTTNVEEPIAADYCSSPESQVSVESEPPKEVPVRKDRKNKFVTNTDHKNTKSKQTGLLKFFERL